MHRIRPANERAAYLVVTNERAAYLVVTNERQLKASPRKVCKLLLGFVVEEHYTQNKTGQEKKQHFSL
jgi:hypothetical protein